MIILLKKTYFADIIELHHDQLGVYGNPATMAAPSSPQIDILDWFKGLFLFNFLSLYQFQNLREMESHLCDK